MRIGLGVAGLADFRTLSSGCLAVGRSRMGGAGWGAANCQDGLDSKCCLEGGAAMISSGRVRRHTRIMLWEGFFCEGRVFEWRRAMFVLVHKFAASRDIQP